MDEIWFLLEEHAALRRAMASVVESARVGSPMVLPQLLRVKTLLELHEAKDQELVVPLLLSKGAVSAEEIREFEVEHEVVFRLLRAAVKFASGDAHQREHILPKVVEGLRVAMTAAMLNEEAFMYPLLCNTCDDDEKWRLSVALDRAVDLGGRKTWSELVAA